MKANKHLEYRVWFPKEMNYRLHRQKPVCKYLFREGNICGHFLVQHSVLCLNRRYNPVLTMNSGRCISTLPLFWSEILFLQRFLWHCFVPRVGVNQTPNNLLEQYMMIIICL